MRTRSSIPQDAERRLDGRTLLHVEVGLGTDTNFYTGLTQDISTGGIFVATHEMRRQGERFRLSFCLPDDPQPIETEVEVRWVREPSRMEGPDAVWGMGLKFLALTHADEARIEGFIRQRESLFYDDE